VTVDPPHADLVARLKRGEPGAFDEVWALYAPRIHRFLRRLAGRADLADDLVQETWMRLARSATRLADDTDLGAWLYTVARNRHRSYRRWALVDALRRPPAVVEAPVDGPEEQLIAARTRAHLEAALARLPSTHREVLLLIGVEGLSHEQAAAVLDVGPEALRQRLSRARAELARQLERIEAGSDAGGAGAASTDGSSARGRAGA
jgi:RNA polymerase sigma-70 factor (ECF subfamily)